MGFYEVLDQVLDLLRQRGRITYRVLKRECYLDDAFLEDLKEEILDAQRVAVKEDGRILVWTGSTDQASAPALPETSSLAREQHRSPLSYIPPHLTEKILASRNALEGERKQVTVLFADIKDSTELIRDLDPEAAQRLLDPAIRIMMEAVHRYKGTVHQVLVDCIMALFGAPIAHEDHALRACYAALAMQVAMRKSTEEVRHAHGIEMCIWIGLNSGEILDKSGCSDHRSSTQPTRRGGQWHRTIAAQVPPMPIG